MLAPNTQQDFHVELVSRRALALFPRWQTAFARQRKDHRFYEIVEDTILQGFDYRYFVIKDGSGEVRAIQPCFLLDQDMLQGVRRGAALVARIRRFWPRFMTLRTLMVGCAAGEGHVDGDDVSGRAAMQALADALVAQGRAHGARLVVLKEFPARYRPLLAPFRQRGFTRIASMPMTSLDIAYASFEDYMTRRLSSKTRKDLRKKFRDAAAFPPIEMTVVTDVSPFVDEIYPLYLAVFERSALHFEKLSKDTFRRLGHEMPDKVRFFIWRQNGRAIAWSLCMLDGKALYAEYLGLDYAVALDLHLYHYVFRDVVSWGIANGFTSFESGGLNYDPKLHFKSLLAPLDLYVRHTSSLLNPLLKIILPLLEPTRYDKTLRKFPNYHELSGDAEPAPRSGPAAGTA